ncbi:hypothetical protein [Micromonospora sp. NPDC048839]|uniref:hypothetical protein n=1 Tax=Micromonospora sp. NPDC048839 TaxID=3155641 RepID=UPI0033F3E753
MSARVGTSRGKDSAVVGNRRYQGFVLGLVVAAVCAVSGCTPERDDDAAAVLHEAVNRLDRESFRATAKVTRGDGQELSDVVGVTDQSRNWRVFTVSVLEDGVKVTTETRQIGHDVYTRFAKDGALVKVQEGKTWVYTDLTRHPRGNGLIEMDVRALLKPLDHIVRAERAGTGNFRGDFDFAAAQGLKDRPQDRAVAFEATVDSQGRLTRLTYLREPAGDSQGDRSELTISEYGTKVQVDVPPAAEITRNPLTK